MQDHTISHTGSVLDTPTEEKVTLYQNQTSPQRLTEVVQFTCPDKFDGIFYNAARDAIRFEPRSKETVASGDVDGSGTYTLDADLIPIAGETEVDDQPYPTVQAVQNGSFLAIESIDYATGEVTLADAEDDTQDLHFYPVVVEGTLKMRGVNQLDQPEGPLFKWPFPLYRFADVEQDKRGQEVNLDGRIDWARNETLEVQIDSPRQIVWDDADHPDPFVSMLEVDVRIAF